MAPQWQLTDLPVGGVDTRTDPVIVVPPKVLEAENVSLDVPGRSRKRGGTRRRATVAKVARGPVSPALFAYPRTIDVKDARWVAVESSGRVLAHADNLLLSESGGNWFVRGFLDQMRITATRPQWDTFATLSTIGICDVGVAGDVLILVWSRGDLSASVGFYDLASGAMIHPVIELTQGSRPRIASIPGTDSCLLVYYQGGVGQRLMAVPIVASLVRAFTMPDVAAHVVAADPRTASPLFDVTVVGQRVLLTYVTTTGDIKRGYIDSGGNPDGAFSAEAMGGATVNALAVHYGDTNARFLVAWGIDASNVLRARDYNASNLAANAAATDIDTLTGYQQIAIGVRGTAWTILYETGDAVLHNRRVTRKEWITSGAPSSAETLRHSSLRSKLWTDTVTGRWYCVMAYESQTQPSAQVTFFVYAVRGYDAAADPTLYEEPFTLVGILWPGLAGGVLPAPFLPQPVVRERVVRLALPWRAKQTEVSKLNGARVVTIEHAPADMQTAVQGGDGASYVPGGLLWRIDEALNGAQGAAFIASEAGFALGPENVTAVGGAGGSVTPAGTYGCRYYYRDFATGERSTAAKGASVTLGGADNRIAHTVPTLAHTNRRNVVIDVYRTKNNPTQADPYYLAATIANDKNADTVSISDTIDDLTLQRRERDYLSFGEADEVAPPACEVMAMGEGRAALAGVDDVATIWISKPRGFGEPLRWGDTLLANADHPTPGRVTAMAWNGPEIVVWRQRSIQVLAGKGPDATGTGGTLEPSQIISHEVGCRSARSLVRVPVGWIFQSAEGQYWQLARTGELAYVGADVERYTEPCVGAFLVPLLRQARFVTGSRTLVLDYETSSWTTWTRTAISAAATPEGRGLYLPARSSALLLEDDPSGYRDDGEEYTQRLRLAWFRPRGVQGEIFVRRLLLAGGLEGAHHPLVRIYYDYEPGHQESYEWSPELVVGTVVAGDGTQVFGGPSRLNIATQVYQFAVPLGRERCQAVGVEILDRSAGGAQQLGASFWLTAVGYEWAPVQAAGADAFRLEERRLAT
jgi:hypothetical protein